MILILKLNNNYNLNAENKIRSLSELLIRIQYNNQAGHNNRDYSEKAKDCIQPETNVSLHNAGDRNPNPY